MTRTEEFLDLYKQLEQAATAAFGWESDGRAIYRLSRMAQFEEQRTELDYCREVRNLLQHNCRIEGAYAVEPSVPMVELLRRLLKQVKEPILCRDVCTQRKKVFARGLSDQVIPTIQEMFRRGLSHVPVLEHECVAGVFSESTVFAYLAGSGREQLPRGLTFQDLRQYLNAPTRRSEVYAYLPFEETLATAEDAFIKSFRKGKRISMFFLTRSGRADEALLGILTPYDILGNGWS